MTTFDIVADLPVQIDHYSLSPLSRPTSSELMRHCTLVELTGGDLKGAGEDVTYERGAHAALIRAGTSHDLAGNWTLGEFCDHVERLDLFPATPEVAVSRNYRVWAFHSAALDLTLRQAGLTLHSVLARKPQPMRYVASLHLGPSPALDPVRMRLALDPTLHFKLDATSSWTPDLIERLAAAAPVDVIDLKGMYRGGGVAQPADPILYSRVAEAFPEAWLEDPDLGVPAAAVVLAAEHERITWDVPIKSIGDIEALPLPPRMVNLKPSRIGSLRRLLDTYDYCAEHGIGAYGGGQTELGVGRGQAQYLAAVFHPDAPNDLAPSAYNLPEPPEGIPVSPLAPVPNEPGFRWSGLNSDLLP